MITRRALTRGLIVTAAAIAANTTRAKQRNPQASVRSPDGKLVLTLDLLSSLPSWSIARGATAILERSTLSLQLSSGRFLGENAEVLGISHRGHSGSWTPKFGIKAVYEDNYNELTMHLRDARTSIDYDIIARVFNSAAAVRHVIVRSASGPLVRLAGEQTQFRFPQSALFYASRDESEIFVGTLQDVGSKAVLQNWPPLTPNVDPAPLLDYPLTVDIGHGTHALLAESDRPHYPRAMLLPLGGNSASTYLMQRPGRTLGPDGKDVSTPAETAFDLPVDQGTPWRIIVTSDTAVGLIEQAGIIPTLAAPSVLQDTDWIESGRAYRIRPPYTTDAGLSAVDWAKTRKLNFIEYDWHWYGDGTDDSDATVPIAGLDIRRIIEYAASKGLRTILYVDRMPATRQLEAVCKTYSDWGVAGIKFGFMWEGRKTDADFLYRVIETCASHRLICDIHDNIRPAGLERTLPNYVALEGVRGNEQFPPARHNVNLAFQRAIAGPMDYTICYAQDRNQTTNAHQLALAVLFYSPQAYLYWYDSWEKYTQGSWPELTWFDEVPVTWDDTRAVDGALGEFVIVARRKGTRWYLGAITNEQSRRRSVSLQFLKTHPDDQTSRWRAHRYCDGEWNKWVWKTAVKMDDLAVTPTTLLEISMNPAGGQAIMFEPAD